ncbi:uncharacterized protein SPSK_01465 [Sporothrix schenckii 1099-18]|uniref:RING-type domain-containing protein n=1 Tax=Sporothrix schenckii 1099-18 TaxID=1397361 RepID=A0A0F2MC05_SPOSC|nr:uncharacterized protein SPSK_01465 [Sporothrix schenckii 1099-18]KJR87172.1 hypothetical protein SPSK_01465 [Sporothrix schenckii 1099-18]
MVFAGLLGTAKQPRRRQSSAASGRSGFLRPGSSSSARTVDEKEKGKDAEDAIDDEDEDTTGEDSANDANDAASTRTMNSARSARSGGGARSGRNTAAISASSPPLHPPDFIADETHLAPVFREAPDLRELNNSLAALAVVFPDVQVDVFREMLTSFDGESRLALVADALLKSRATWVKGRWRIANKDKSPPLPSASSSASSSVTPTASAISAAERFRTPEYKKAVKTLASHEFMGLSRSTINAVLAEQNYAYLDARRTLVEMSSKSWRFTISSLFLRRKPVASTEAENHPLVIWKSTGQGSIIPTIKATGSAELDRELYTALVAPLRAQKRSEQEDADRTMASALNTAEAEAAGATFECACCFTSTTFEEVTTCSNSDGGDDGDGAHIICFRCVQHSVREAVFGQGWARTIDTSRGTLWCPAVSHTECRGIIPVDHMQRALLDEKRGADTLQHLERRLADHSLVGSGLPLVRCPFCAYAEIDDIYVPFHEAPLRIRVDGLYSLAFILLVSGVTHVLILPLLVLLVLVTILPGFMAPVGLASWVVSAWSALKCNFGGVDSSSSSSSSNNNNNGTLRRRKTAASSKPNYFCEQVSAAVTRFRRRRRGQQFRCQNPACARVSCIGCSKAWTDIHVCHESSLVALRTQVEQAMSMAIKRVCPRCHTSFVKAVGCNKLTCPCGYKMCYVCRKDISGNEGPDAGYRHFCEHFRPHGDGRPCTQCRRCNLWETEDTEAVLQAAREEAERKWRETEQRDLSLSERAYLETGIAIGGGTAAGGSVRVSGGSSGAGGPGVGFGATPTGAILARRAMTGVVAWATSLLSWSPLSGKEEGGGRRTAAEAFDAANQARFPTLAETLDWLLESILV